MTNASTNLRRPLAVGAAILISAASFMAVSAGPVSAGRPLEFTVTPATAQVGDSVAVESVVACFDYERATTVEVTVFDADDNEVYEASGTLDDDLHWTATIDTTGLVEGEYTVEAVCDYGPEQYSNYQSETLSLTAAPVDPTTTTTVTPTTDMATTTTTESPTETVNQPAAAAPAAAVAAAPAYTG